jgi:NADH-quinone oxidoreductase subunit J
VRGVELMNPLLVYGLVALGGVGVAAALPRRAVGPQIVGALIAAIAGGLLILFLSVKAQSVGQFPNIYFYIFGAVAIGAALRVITHPKPVYAALYFILTILATAGLFLILSAEFMAFALIIVYAGAILITYLFVIMLATQAPEENVEVLADYDVKAKDPTVAALAAFALLGALTGMMFRGVESMPTTGGGGVGSGSAALVAEMPRKVERVLKEHGLLKDGERVAMVGEGDGARVDIDLEAGIVWVEAKDGGARREIPREEWPEALATTNVEALGFNLLRDHPGAIEIAGVILLMAMLGAVVLSRKQVEIDEELKMRQARGLGMTMDVSPAAAGSVPPIEGSGGGRTPGGAA